MKRIIALSAVAFLSTAAFASSTMETKFAALMEKMEQMEKRELAQQKKIDVLTSKMENMQTGVVVTTPNAKNPEIELLKKKLAKIEKKQAKHTKNISAVKKMAAKDNIKFSLDFRNTVEMLDYEDKLNDLHASNNSLLTSRLYLKMAASPMDGLIFSGKLAIYSTWGSHLYVDDAPLKNWSGSSKPSDTVMRVKEAYFVYTQDVGDVPVSLSIGRRPATNGFLANYRENEPTAGSPAGHITNMEVDALMLQFNLDDYVTGAYTKLVYGRAHSGETNNVYSAGADQTPWGPYAKEDSDLEDENVDFALILGDAYNDGQYQLMYQYAHIFDTKGLSTADAAAYQAWKDGGEIGTAPFNGKKGAAGVADLASLSLKIDGIGDEINDFLDDTTVFVSGAYTNYNAKSGHTLMGSSDGGSKSGQSIWLGVIIPDGLTDKGRFGFEYNHGSQYWTPMTWAEDTAIGSKIAVRGDAYEAYWNFDLFGVKYLPSQIRYTYVQHDYTPNINCAGWVTPTEADIVAQNLRFAVTYRY
ncbi:MAG: DUF3373 family protein [Sulfurimonas sp.]|nr:DUF3373 family protein [Sulfurimonas sp.]